MSVVIALECTGGIDILLSGHAGFGVARFTVELVRALGCGIVRAPDPALPGHAHVTGKKTYGRRSRFSRGCGILRKPVVEADH